MRTSEYKQSEGGLYLPLGATVKGRVRWQVLDERGVPEIPRTPSGIPVGPVEGVEQDNLITDLGMDHIGQYSVFKPAPNSTQITPARYYLAVGTGSGAPDAADVTLDNEVQRAASSGSFAAGDTTYALDTVNDVFRAEALVTRVVTMTDDRNLTEFGFSPAASDAIGIRELLRDGGGNPITVSLLNGKTIRVDHTYTIEIAAPPSGHAATIDVEEYDAGNNLVNTIPYDIIHGGNADNANAEAVFGVWHPADATRSNEGNVNNAYARRGKYRTAPTAYSRTLNDSASTSVAGVALAGYTPGSHQRVKRFTVGSGDANVPWYGFSITYYTSSSGSNSFPRMGWIVLFDDPVTYTKQSTDTLRFGFVSTWARA